MNGDETLVDEHDEQESGQQELYLVLDGEAEFELAGEGIRVTKGTAIAVTDPTVSRRAIARAPGTTMLAIGAGDGAFATTRLGRWSISSPDRAERLSSREGVPATSSLKASPANPPSSRG